MCAGKAEMSRPVMNRGSTPRARGKHSAELSVVNVLRLNPTCAGKTEIGALMLAERGAQPHVRGENSS